jgi:hypothetical protein
MKNRSTSRIPYKDRDDAYITVSRLESPYGPESSPVISIGCTLKGDIDNPTWKVHVPLNLITEVIEAVARLS